MKRLHVHVAVSDLDAAIAFYNDLFAAAPTVREADYAKWMLDDPRVNFAISTRGRAAGLDHLGIQVDAAEELAELEGRMAAASHHMVQQREAQCCYAKGDKAWMADPAGIAWEAFHTTGGITEYGRDSASTEELLKTAGTDAPMSACCAGPGCAG